MYSIEIEHADGSIDFYGETFDEIRDAKFKAMCLEGEDADIENCTVVITETGEAVK